MRRVVMGVKTTYNDPVICSPYPHTLYLLGYAWHKEKEWAPPQC